VLDRLRLNKWGGHSWPPACVEVGLSRPVRGSCSHAALNLTRIEADPLGPERLTRAHPDLLVPGSERPTRVEPNPLRPECSTGVQPDLASADRSTGAEAHAPVAVGSYRWTRNACACTLLPSGNGCSKKSSGVVFGPSWDQAGVGHLILR
jgi:hypothetical protein